MSNKVDVSIVVIDGELKEAYNDALEAQERVDDLRFQDVAYVTEEFGLDEDDETYVEDSAFMAGYEGDHAYCDTISVDLNDLNKNYSTCEGDEFSGEELIGLYSESGYNAEINSYPDEDDDYDPDDDYDDYEDDEYDEDEDDGFYDDVNL